MNGREFFDPIILYSDGRISIFGSRSPIIKFINNNYFTNSPIRRKEFRYVTISDIQKITAIYRAQIDEIIKDSDHFPPNYKELRDFY